MPKRTYRKKSGKKGSKKGSKKSYRKKGSKKSYRKKGSKKGSKKSYRKKGSKKGSKRRLSRFNVDPSDQCSMSRKAECLSDPKCQYVKRRGCKTRKVKDAEVSASAEPAIVPDYEFNLEALGWRIKKGRKGSKKSYRKKGSKKSYRKKGSKKSRGKKSRGKKYSKRR